MLASALRKRRGAAEQGSLGLRSWAFRFRFREGGREGRAVEGRGGGEETLDMP